MAGFWHLSHHQMRDPNGAVLAGARAYFFKSDSLLPIKVYQDYGLGTPHPNPVQANASGIFPPVFFDEEDGFYRQRITTTGGIIVPGTDVGILPIIGPSEGSGGSEVPVDNNALLKTGDPLWVMVSGSRAGFVRLNNRSIGSAISGASERANADCEALYLHNWATYNDTLCPVTGGRGISAAADWAANKPMGLIDMRGRAPFGLADMGNSDSGRLSDLTFGYGNATTPGAFGGNAYKTLSISEIPNHNHTLTDPGHTHTVATTTTTASYGRGDGDIQVGFAFGSVTSSSKVTGISIAAVGGGSGFDMISPFMLGTWYQKL